MPPPLSASAPSLRGVSTFNIYGCHSLWNIIRDTISCSHSPHSQGVATVLLAPALRTPAPRVSLEGGPGPLPMLQELTVPTGGLSLHFLPGFGQRLSQPVRGLGEQTRPQEPPKEPRGRGGHSQEARNRLTLSSWVPAKAPTVAGECWAQAGPQETGHSRAGSCHVCVFTAAPPARLFQGAKESVCLRKRMWQRGRRRWPHRYRAHPNQPDTRSVTQRLRGQGHGLRDTLHPHPPDGPAPP